MEKKVEYEKNINEYIYEVRVAQAVIESRFAYSKNNAPSRAHSKIAQELIDATMSGMEDIAGQKGHHWIRDTYAA